ncbi:hypothetical protein D3C72_2510620 [compost metagenome]
MGRVGAGRDAVDILLKARVEGGKTPHGQDRNADEEKDQQAESQSELGAYGEFIHDVSPKIRGDD